MTTKDTSRAEIAKYVHSCAIAGPYYTATYTRS